MQTLLLHHSGPLGGILEQSPQYEIVELRLRAGNEIPPYQYPAAIVLLTLSGSAEIRSNGESAALTPDHIITLEPQEIHTIRATADNTHIIAIKNLTSAA
ncbi:MAG: AraC family ligand binding domain-containing protein [Cardiobacteriaceae bacterium]|nr:AraC family ligand binding domain-containing protein [Cardiobacteriaceae bacterium]